MQPTSGVSSTAPATDSAAIVAQAAPAPQVTDSAAVLAFGTPSSEDGLVEIAFA